MLVTREELRSRIWPEESFGDFDHAVNVAVGKLRTALGDSADNPLFIETVPRRGYRFVALLEGSPVETQPAAISPVIGDPPSGGRNGRRLVLKTVLVLVAAGILVAVGVLLRTAYGEAGCDRVSASDGPAWHCVFGQVCAGWAQCDLQRFLGWRARRNILKRREFLRHTQHGIGWDCAACSFFLWRNGSGAGGQSSIHVDASGNSRPGSTDGRFTSPDCRECRLGGLGPGRKISRDRARYGGQGAS